MTMDTLRAGLRRALWLVLLLPAVAMVGCVGSGSDGIGGTGAQVSTDGIGGTGAPVAGVEHDPDGIGGTGIVGEITALGSVVVNGLTVELPASLAVTRNGLPVAQDSLSPGQVVAVVAVSRGAALEARSLEVLDALIGPVSPVTGATGRFEVLGQTLPVPKVPAGVQAGERVRVSGFWRPDGSLDVTRVERASAAEPDLVMGPVSGGGQGRGNDLRVGGVVVTGVGIQVETPGDHVRVLGDASGRAIRSNAVHPAPFARLLGKVERLIVEGHPDQLITGRVRLGPLQSVIKPRSTVEAPLRSATASGRRVVVDARVLGARTEIQRVRPVTPVTPRAVPAPRIVAPPGASTPARPERPERPERIERPPKPERPTTLRDSRPVDVRPIDVRPIGSSVRGVR